MRIATEPGEGRGEAQYLSDLAIVWERRAQSDRAIAHYDRALACDPAYGAAHLHLGILLQALDRISEARAVFRRGISSLS